MRKVLEFLHDWSNPMAVILFLCGVFSIETIIVFIAIDTWFLTSRSRRGR